MTIQQEVTYPVRVAQTVYLLSFKSQRTKQWKAHFMMKKKDISFVWISTVTDRPQRDYIFLKKI